jgi:DNA-3-methyladenine glycosylase
MRERRGLEDVEGLCSGPGKLTDALGVGLSLNGVDLAEPPFEIRPPTAGWQGTEIVADTRIGITKAAELPWRYCVKGSRFVSKPWPRLTASPSVAPVAAAHHKSLRASPSAPK